MANDPSWPMDRVGNGEAGPLPRNPVCGSGLARQAMGLIRNMPIQISLTILVTQWHEGLRSAASSGNRVRL